MKKLNLFFLMFLVLACEPGLEIPIKVSKAFWSKYEKAKEVEWVLKDGVYEVSYTVSDFHRISFFETNGYWIRTMAFLPPKRSMVCVQDFVDDRYPGAEIKMAVFIETPESENYFITISKAIEPDEEIGEEPFDSTDEEISQTGETLILVFDSECEFEREESEFSMIDLNDSGKQLN